jgi:2-polyprenyl-3-methyl-5-hydroxy-6-metoxy-1,4-benzoquinol methylase
MNIVGQNVPKQRDYWNRVAEDFDSIYAQRKSRLGRWLDRTFRADMFERLDYTLLQADPIPGHTLLDVGCGTGRYCLAFARKGAQRVVGIDFAPSMIQRATELAAESDLSDICEFRVQTIEDMSETEVFDVVIGIGLLDYFSHPESLLQLMHRHARERVILSFPRSNTWRAPLRKVRLTLRGCDVHFYSESKVRQLIKENGGQLLDLRVVGKLFCTTSHPAGSQRA